MFSTHVFCSHSSNMVVDKLNLSGSRLVGVALVSQLIKLCEVPVSKLTHEDVISSLFLRVFFFVLHLNPVPHSTYKELRFECTRVKAACIQRDLSIVIVSLFTMLFFTETVGIPYGSCIISSVRDLLLVRFYKS